jgi:hypothetical protein
VADNVAITAGSGTDIATDDVAGVHFQKVKLAFGGDDTATAVQNGAGLPVELQAGVFGYETADEAVSQNPVLVGGRAYATPPAAVSADGDAVWAWYDRAGRLMVGTRATPRTLVHAQVAYTAAQTAATVYTPASGKKLCVVHIVVSASAAGTVKLFDGTDTSANSWSPILSLAANGGWEAHFSDEAPLVMSAADNVLKYTSGAGAAGSIWLHGWEE